jgi:putative peptidoglycan lipid II flippase
MAIVSAVVVLAVGGFLLGLELIAANRVPDLEPADSPQPTAATPAVAEQSEQDVAQADPQAVPVVAVSDFDPLGNGSENPERTELAIDGDPQTAWPTQTYFDPLELQKAGVGLLLDLGSPQQVSEVELVLLNQTSDVEIRVAPDTSQAPPSTPEGYIQLTRAERAGSALTVDGDPRTTRFVLVWFTRLPQTDEGWRGGVGEVVVRG